MGSELRLYDVTVGRHQTRMRLDDNDAKHLGDAAVLVSERPAIRPTLAAAPPVDPKARPVTSNKMRGEAGTHTKDAD